MLDASKPHDKSLFLEKEIDSSFVARKRLFIGLITGTSILICISLVLLWIIPYVGLKNIHPLAPWILGFLVLGLIVFIAWASLGLIINIILGKNIFFSQKLRGLSIKFFLPLMTLLGRLLGIPKQKVRASFIKVNNELISAEHKQYASNDVLMLMPHCLQSSSCKIRLTYDIFNCKRCGKCPIAGLLELSEKYGVKLAIATGGTIARRIVVQARPKFIIAVACERDLASGIQDTYPIPVYGILNLRPCGPCIDTLVLLDHVQWVLNKFVLPLSKR